MSGWKKLASAAAASGAALNVEDVFSTYVWTSAGLSSIAIQNGIDLQNEGGLVWVKSRTNTENHVWVDTERGKTKAIFSNQNYAEDTDSTGYMGSFNTDGFNTGESAPAGGTAGQNYASWTFRKAPKFFDVVTWSGDGTSTGRTISHNLGADVGMIIIKNRDFAQDWQVWHKDLSTGYMLKLNLTNAEQGFNEAILGNGTSFIAPTSTEFTVGIGINNASHTYVAYLFAHNDGDGDFGPNGDQDIIKCGSYTANGSVDGPEIDLGFEPQWVIIKSTQTNNNWWIVDTMRGMVTGSADAWLKANTSDAENTNTASTNALLSATPTGFKITTTNAGVNYSTNTYIYMAIRRGPMAVPESATDVFGMDTYGGTLPNPPAFDLGAPVDFGMWKQIASTSWWATSSRLQQGKVIYTNSTDAEANDTSAYFDYQEGWYNASGTSTSVQSWMWRRAPNFFDVVAYTGTGSNQTISHNLGVAPKFMIVKERTTANNWVCYLEALGNDKRMALNAASAVATDTTAWQSTTPTDSAFYVGANTQTNVSGEEFIAYLFGEVAGISKIGTYTGTGAAQNIDCGFSSGARFVLTKTYAGTNPNADWNIWDSERGIVAGNDPYLALNSTSAQVASTDVIDPYSSGFSLTSSGVANNSGTSYWFYAIA